MRSILNFVLNVVAAAISLWVVVALVPGINIYPPATGQGWFSPESTTGTFVAIAIVFTLFNAIITPVLRMLGAPITCITLGLFALVINGAVLLMVAWILNNTPLNLGTLTISGWWAAIFGAGIIGLVSSVVNFFTSPLRRI